MSPKFLLVCGLFVAAFFSESVDSKCTGAKCKKLMEAKQHLQETKATLLKKYGPEKLKELTKTALKDAKAGIIKKYGPAKLKQMKAMFGSKVKAGFVKKFGAAKLQKVQAYLAKNYKPGEIKQKLNEIRKKSGPKGVQKFLEAQLKKKSYKKCQEPQQSPKRTMNI